VADEESRADALRDPLFVLALLAAGAILLAFAWPLLGGRVYVNSDLGRFHIPMRWFYASALARGEGFLWLPYEYTGFYLHGEGQAALAHPLNWLQYRLLPFRAAFAVELLRSYVFLLLGTFLLLRRFGVTSAGAAFGSLAFGFGSFNFLHFMHMNFTGIVSHVPWVLLATDVALRSERRSAVATARLGIALLTASQLLQGHPQVTWMSLVVLGAYALDWLARGSAGSRADRLRALVPIALSVALGFLMGAVQLLPQWEGLQRSFRAEPGQGFIASYALDPINAVQLVAPYLFEDRTVGANTSGFAFYMGGAALPLVVWALMRRGRLGAAWPWARFGVAIAVVAFVLALGRAGGLYRLQELLPLVGLFRAPGRYLLLCELGLAIAAVAAFADLARRGRQAVPWRSLWPLALPLAASVLAPALLSAADRGAWQTRAGLALFAGPLLVGAATLLVVAGARRRRRALALLVLLTAADLGFYGMSFVRSVPAVDLATWAGLGIPSPVPPGLRVDRAFPKDLMREIRMASGYSAMVPDRVLPVGLWKGLESIDPDTLRNARRVSSVVLRGRQHIAGTLPRFRLVAAAAVSDDPLALIGRIDVATTAIVPEPVRLGDGPPGTVRPLVDRPGHIRVATHAPSPQLLVVSESYHPGWRSGAGTAECRVLPVYGDFMGCVVPAGSHEVELVFEPGGWVWGLRLSVLGLGIALAGFAVALARRAGVIARRLRRRRAGARPEAPRARAAARARRPRPPR